MKATSKMRTTSKMRATQKWGQPQKWGQLHKWRQCQKWGQLHQCQATSLLSWVVWEAKLSLAELANWNWAWQSLPRPIKLLSLAKRQNTIISFCTSDKERDKNENNIWPSIIIETEEHWPWRRESIRGLGRHVNNHRKLIMIEIFR